MPQFIASSCRWFSKWIVGAVVPIVSSVPFLLLCLVLVPSLQASSKANSSTVTVTKDPQAMSVVQNALIQSGGTTAYQDSLATGTSTENAVATPVTLKSKGTQLFRADYSNPKGTTSYILNQGIAVIENPDGTVTNLVTNNTFGERVLQVPLGSLLAEYQAALVDVIYSGVTQVNGSTVDTVTMDVLYTTSDSVSAAFYRSITSTIFYIDQKSGLLIKVQYPHCAENETNAIDTIEVYFSDYRNINGVQVPFHQTTYDNGALDEDIVLESMSLNVGLPDSDFTLPK